MTITVLTPPESTDLTTLERVKLFSGITGTTKDALINALIPVVSDQVRKITGRTFARQVSLEKLPGTGESRLMVSITPIRTITSISFRDGLLSPDKYEITDVEAGLIQIFGGTRLTAEVFVGLTGTPIVGSERLDYEVEYDGGYDLQSFDTPGTPLLPQDLELAVISLVRFGTESPGQSVILSEVSTGKYRQRMAQSEGFGQNTIIAQAMGIINLYKRAD